MTHIVVLGAGIGGVSMAYELREHIGRNNADITLLSNNDYFQFTPSNPWVGVGTRKRNDIVVPLEKPMKKMGIDFNSSGAKKVKPADNSIELNDGSTLDYDYLVIATGPALAFDEIEGLGPTDGYTQSVCTVDHAEVAGQKWEEFCKNPGPIVVGAVQGASCYGPAYEHAMIMDHELRKRKIRDKVPMTFVTAEPYIGHLGLGGVGDTKGFMESEMRQRDIRWITNARVEKVEDGLMHVTEVNEDGSNKKEHELAFDYSMMLPAFRGIDALSGIEGLGNPRDFVIVDKHQRNPTYPDVFSVGVCIAIPPYEPTPIPVGVPKTGFMIESMVRATALNIVELMAGGEPTHEPTWNALCLADFGDTGIAFVAQPQIPPRNINWSSDGKWVHLAKVAFEKYFLRKVRKGSTEPVFEKLFFRTISLHKTK